MARTRTYNADAVLDAAMQTFWTHGFDRTSVGDLVQATGVARSVLYQEWTDKVGLLLACLDRYGQAMAERVFAPAHTPNVSAVRQIFETVADEVVRTENACLVIETALAVAPHEPRVAEQVAHQTQGARRAFQAILEHCVATGSLAASTPVQEHAQHLAISLQGLLLQGRLGPQAGALKAYVNLVLQPLERMEIR